jgi:hypothetical protein
LAGQRSAGAAGMIHAARGHDIAILVKDAESIRTHNPHT